MSGPSQPLAYTLVFGLGAVAILGLCALGLARSLVSWGRLPAVALTYEDGLARLEASGDPVALAEQSRMAMLLDVASPRAAARAAEDARAAGEPQAEIEALERWVHRAPSDPSAHWTLGARLVELQMARGRETGAMDRGALQRGLGELQIAAERRPDAAELQRLIGGVMKVLGDAAGAEQHLAEAARLDAEGSAR